MRISEASVHESVYIPDPDPTQDQIPECGASSTSLAVRSTRSSAEVTDHDSSSDSDPNLDPNLSPYEKLRFVRLEPDNSFTGCGESRLTVNFNKEGKCHFFCSIEICVGQSTCT